MVTDLCVYITNPTEIDTIAKKIAALLPDTRVLTRSQIQKTYQVVGEPEVIEGDVEFSSEPIGLVIPEEDIELVATQANVSYEEAKQALQECDGELAEAIIKLMS